MEDRSVPQNLGFGERDGTVFAFIDESYDPFVAAASVIVESSDIHRLDSNIAATYDRVKNWYHMRGMPSFEAFRQHGFHANNDPLEVRIAFVAFLTEALNFKSLIVYSDRSSRADISDKKRLIIIVDQLLRDVLRAYRGRPKIVFFFESAQAMDKYIERLVAHVSATLGSRGPQIEVRFGTKRQPHLLAVPDYVLHIFNQWRKAQDSDTLVLDPADHKARSFNAVLGSISMARSVDDGNVVRRTSLDQPLV